MTVNNIGGVCVCVGAGRVSGRTGAAGGTADIRVGVLVTDARLQPSDLAGGGIAGSDQAQVLVERRRSRERRSSATFI